MIAQVIYLSDGIDGNSIWGRPGLGRYNPFSINCLGGPEIAFAPTAIL